jgi:hypothetical protein
MRQLQSGKVAVQLSVTERRSVGEQDGNGRQMNSEKRQVQLDLCGYFLGSAAFHRSNIVEREGSITMSNHLHVR